MLHVKIRVLSFFNQPLDSFVMYLRQSSALGTHHLHPHRFSDDQFIFGCRATSLSVMRPQNLCQNKQIDGIIYRSDRNSLFFTRFHQLLCREGLRQLTDLLQHHVSHSGRAHAVCTQIGIQLLKCLIMYLAVDHRFLSLISL